MAGGITIEQAIDLGHATLQAFKQDAIEMAMARTTYEVVNRWFKKDKRVLDGGDVVTAYITLKDTGNAKHVRMYETDDPNVANTDKKITVKEIAMNMNNKRRIYNLLKQRRLNCAREFADLLEAAAWKTPQSADDDRAPHGIPAWIVQADTSAVTGNFEGYVGDYTTVDDSESPYSTVGGLACNSTTNTRWANWYANHGGNLDHSLLKLLRRAFRKTHFQTPAIAGQAIDPNSDFSNFRLYANSETLDALEDLAFKSDDRIGYDLGKYAGAVVFKGIPFVYIEDLDDELTYVRGKDPIYGVNHNHFYPVILADENFRWNKPMTKVGQHNVLTVYVDLTYAYICDNRRAAGFLISNWEGAY